MRENDVFEPDWKRRRRMAFGVVAFCAAGIVWLLFRGNDGALHVNMSIGFFTLLGSVALGYLGFPMLDDRDRRRQFVAYRSSLPEPVRATGGTTTGRVDDPGD
jgi:hypothetical protein